MGEKDKVLCPHCGKELDVGILLGSKTPDKKTATPAGNDKIGIKPQKAVTDLTLNVMENGKPRTLKLINEGPNRFSLVVCYPDGQQIKAKRQPIWGSSPDIVSLASENGFDSLDARTFQ
jgi:hypothetical protein